MLPLYVFPEDKLRFRPNGSYNLELDSSDFLDLYERKYRRVADQKHQMYVPVGMPWVARRYMRKMCVWTS